MNMLSTFIYLHNLHKDRFKNLHLHLFFSVCDASWKRMMWNYLKLLLNLLPIWKSLDQTHATPVLRSTNQADICGVYLLCSAVWNLNIMNDCSEYEFYMESQLSSTWANHHKNLIWTHPESSKRIKCFPLCYLVGDNPFGLDVRFL